MAPATSTRFTRRSLIGGAAISAGALAGGGITAPSVFGGKQTGTTARNPLRQLQALGAGTTLRAQPGSVQLAAGARPAGCLTYNGLMPGPVVECRRGDAVALTLENGLTQDTSIHWHGLVVPTEADGQPYEAIGPGASYDYRFTVDQRASLNFFHPHPHHLTGEQVCLGLAGGFVIRDDEETALGLPTGKYEVGLVIRDAKLDSRGNLAYGGKASGFLGNIGLVNGTRDATLSVDRALYRFRIVNGATARIFRLALSSGSFVLIGNDGGLLPAATTEPELVISPGERLDLLVDLRGVASGAAVMLRDLNSGWNLLELKASSVVVSAPGLPGALPAVDALSGPSAPTRTFSFDGMSRINGAMFDMHSGPLFDVPFDTTERWRFATNGNAPHPVHIHGASFQVQSRSGGRGRLYPWERGWKDTVLLEDGESVDVLIRFTGFRGRYLIHCHKLEHEDAGMMIGFEVT